MANILITGSNRGLGLEWVRQYSEAGWRVYATCRQPQQATELQQLATQYKTVTVHQLDVTDDTHIEPLAHELQNHSIDLLINNAGVYFEKFTSDNIGNIDYSHWQETFNVNCLGAMRVSEAFTPHVQRSETRLIVATTSHMGSITEIGSAGSYAYRSSKAALNAAMKGLSLELQHHHIGVLLLHPGWVKTRMGGPGALLTTRDSVTGMRRIIEQFTMRSSGQFFRYDGSRIPW
jgi:NAD(P)-dependent dehydrogenase (short-subunit alcohol dehydrogenase family)